MRKGINTPEKHYRWNKLTDATVDANGITIFVNGKRAATINSDKIGYYDLLHSIPAHYPSFDNQFRTNFYASLTGCPCCGLMAFDSGVCCNCSYGKARAVLKLTDSEAEAQHLRQMQLLHFSMKEYSGANQLQNTPVNGFAADPTWKPVISADEIRAERD